MYYVVDIRKKEVVHQGRQNQEGWEQCLRYVHNACNLFGAKRADFRIAAGAKSRDKILRGAESGFIVN